MNIDIQAIIDYLPNLLPGLVILIITILVFQVINGVIYKQLRKFDEQDLVDALADRINQMGWLTALITGLYLGVSVTPGVDPLFTRGLYFLFIITWGWQTIRLVLRVINFATEKAIAREGTNNDSAYRFLGITLKVVMWMILILLILSNLGYDITSLVAGLGISGIAVALAVQSLLGDFISSLSIVADKPFKVGDFIIVGSHKGTVEKIGLRSTRVRSFEGENLVIPNSELVKTIVRNFGDISVRRAKHTIGVTYSTESTLLKDIPTFILDILNSVDLVENSTARVNLIEYGDSSINFEVVFKVAAKEYEHFLEIQQEVLYKIMDKFLEEGIEFAYPTRTVYSITQK